MIVPDLVNQVASVLRRPAVLEDTKQRMVAFSPQDDRIDTVRQYTILSQRAGNDVSRWLQDVGVFSTDLAMHVPGNGALGMLPRLCVPVHVKGRRLGHLWFIDAPEPLTAAQVAVASDFAARIAEAWRDVSRDATDATSDSIDRTMRLLTGSAKTRNRVARDLMGRGQVWHDGNVRVVVLSAHDPGGAAEPSDEMRRELRAIAGAAVTSAGGTGLYGSIGRQSVVILTSGASTTEAAVTEIAHRMLGAAEARLGGVAPGNHFSVGVGSSVDALSHARASYREARQAVELGAAFSLPERVLSWSNLGMYRLLHTAASKGASATDVQPRFDELLVQRDGAVLLETLECYLATGGHVQSAAAELSLHRSSLYHRLSRIEKILGADLQDGVHRLNLHAALLLHRLEL